MFIQDLSIKIVRSYLGRDILVHSNGILGKGCPGTIAIVTGRGREENQHFLLGPGRFRAGSRIGPVVIRDLRAGGEEGQKADQKADVHNMMIINNL